MSTISSSRGAGLAAFASKAGWAIVSLAVCHAAAAAPNADGEVVPADEAAATAAVTDMIRKGVQAGFEKNGRALRDTHRKAYR